MSLNALNGVSIGRLACSRSLSAKSERTQVSHRELFKDPRLDSSRAACLDSRWRQQLQRRPRTRQSSRIYVHASARATAGPIRKLVMMRHADSEDPGSGRDFDRSITEGGRQAARQVAEQLAARGWLPDLIVCSNSKRTQQTLKAMQAAVGALKNARTLFRGELYITAALDGQTRKHLEELIADETQDSAVQCILCLGHNKGWEEAASSFSGCSVRLQPANAALLQGRGVSWQEALHGQAVLHLVDTLLPSPAADAIPGSGIPTLA